MRREPARALTAKAFAGAELLAEPVRPIGTKEELFVRCGRPTRWFSDRHALTTPACAKRQRWDRRSPQDREDCPRQVRLQARFHGLAETRQGRVWEACSHRFCVPTLVIVLAFLNLALPLSHAHAFFMILVCVPQLFLPTGVTLYCNLSLFFAASCVCSTTQGHLVSVLCPITRCVCLSAETRVH